MKKWSGYPCFIFVIMDDILMMAERRWHLKKGIRVVKQELAGLELETYPDKTFAGRTEKRFDFPGIPLLRGKRDFRFGKQDKILKKTLDILEIRCIIASTLWE